MVNSRLYPRPALTKIFCLGLSALLAFQTVTSTTAHPSPQTGTPPSPTIFDHLASADGLSESTVTAIVQDELGFMWFATQNGLNKYDGYEFTVYTHNPNQPDSLSANNIRSLYLDSQGFLWVGTWGGGLNRFNRQADSFTVYRNNPSDPQTLSGNFIWSVKEDASGQLWVGTQTGLNRLDPQTGLVTRYLNDPNDTATLSHDEAHALAPDSNGGIWIGTASGLNYLNISTQTITRFSASSDLASANIFSLIFDQQGYLWAGTSQGLYQIDPATQSVTPYLADPTQPGSLSNNFVLGVYEDRAGNLWVGTREGGVNRLDRATGQFTLYQNNPDDPTTISGNTTSAFFEDRSGILWIGTWVSDINLLDPYRRKFPPQLPFTLPTGIAAAEPGHIWVATFGDGLYNVQPDTGAQIQYRHDPDNPDSLRNDQIFSLYRDRQGNLWVGTYTGLDRLAPNSTRFEHYPSEPGQPNALSNPTVRAIYEDAAGAIWVGTMGGLNRLDLTTGDVTHYLHDPENPNSLSGDVVYSIQGDSNGIIWVGTTNGLNRLDIATGNITRYLPDPNQPNSLANNEVNVIHIAEDNTLWLGTWGGGLDHFDPVQNTFEHYTKANGLSDDLVLGILEDASGKLWLTTSWGITVFDPQTKTARIYDDDDGLPAAGYDQNAYWQNDDGEIFVGAGTGVVAFHPDDLHDNPYPPTVALTDFQLFNQSVSIGDGSIIQQTPNFLKSVTLTHEQSVFSFEFVALSFTNSVRNQYAYKLDGFDRDWNEVGTRRLATYTNLNPGTYTFRVKASNNDGLWSEDDLAIEVTILPPWWQTWWAYTLYVLLGAGLILAVIQLRTRAQAIELARERKLRESLERVEQMKDEDRARLAREMHDGLAQTLAGLRFRSNTWKTLLNNNADRLPAEFDDLGNILDESLEDVRRSIFDLRPLLLDEEGLFAAIEQFTTSLGEQYGVQMHVHLEGDEKSLPSDIAHAAFRIIQELSHNAMKHAQAANLYISLSIGRDLVSLDVRDDGLGFDTSQIAALTQSEHYGLDHLQRRVALLKGSVAIESAAQQGTTVRITLPL